MKSQVIISPSVIFTKQDEIMEQVIARMIDDKVSSVLVTNEDEEIVGIVTERDIVRKFTLLSKSDKLKAKVITVMTRPVNFVYLDSIDEDIAHLHSNFGIRHFPVLSSNKATLENLVGMLTSTDIFRLWIAHEKYSGEVESQELLRFLTTL